MEKLDYFQHKIRLAVGRLHKMYHKSPYIFLTEADIQCMLYSELTLGCSKKRRTIVLDINGRKLKDWNYGVVTIPLHAELSTRYRKKGEFVDLCVIDTKKMKFWIQKSKFNRLDKKFPYWEYQWNPKDFIGIEIKFNDWLQKKIAYSRSTKRERHTQNWSYLQDLLATDLWKLRKYKRGWLIFVDQHSLIKNYKEWRELMDKLIRKYNHGKMKKTLNAYYLCPKLDRPLSYKAPYNSF
jgi:hypothetical protein